jgi:hypothetical protein
MPHFRPLPETLPVPDWHWQVIQDRLDAHRIDPGAARPWEEVREEITEKLKELRFRREDAPTPSNPRH